MMSLKESLARERLEEMFGAKLPKRKLVVGFDSEGFPKVHQFDMVSKDLRIVGEIKSGRNSDTTFKAALSDCIYMSKVKAKRKLLVLTDKDFCSCFKSKAHGIIPNDVEVIFVQV
jgi:hypothetical protein